MRSVTARLYGILTLASVMALVAGCAATSPSAYRNRDEPINRTTGTGQEYRGTVVRVDEPHRVVVLDNGQMYRVTGEQVIVNGQPVMLERVQPGTPVTIVSGTPVVHQNGQYVTLAPGTTVAAAPPGTIVAAPVNRSAVRMYGHVTDIEGNGNVKVRLLDGDAFEFRAPSGTVTRKGEPVTIDMTFGVPAPSALPR